jgi:hypothetical protein
MYLFVYYYGPSKGYKRSDCRQRARLDQVRRMSVETGFHVVRFGREASRTIRTDPNGHSEFHEGMVTPENSLLGTFHICSGYSLISELTRNYKAVICCNLECFSRLFWLSTRQRETAESLVDYKLRQDKSSTSLSGYQAC